MNIGNGYTYVGNNPLRYLDPLGLTSVEVNEGGYNVKIAWDEEGFAIDVEGAGDDPSTPIVDTSVQVGFGESENEKKWKKKQKRKNKKTLSDEDPGDKYKDGDGCDPPEINC